jgi:hypothetical protein
VVAPPLPQPLCLPASEVGQHRVNLSFHDNMSSRAVMRDAFLFSRPELWTTFPVKSRGT